MYMQIQTLVDCGPCVRVCMNVCLQSFAIFGGLSPLMVSALAVGLQNRAYIAAGVIVDITAGLSIMAGLALALVSPHVNHTEKALAEAVAVPEAAAGAVNADVSVAGGDDAVRDQELSRV